MNYNGIEGIYKVLKQRSEIDPYIGIAAGGLLGAIGFAASNWTERAWETLRAGNYVRDSSSSDDDPKFITIPWSRREKIQQGTAIILGGAGALIFMTFSSMCLWKFGKRAIVEFY